MISIKDIQLNLKEPYPVHLFESVTSTNTVAAEMARDGAPYNSAVIARHQTHGRGRLGRTFASPDDSGIYMSIILEPIMDNPVLITTGAAVAVCKAIEKVCDHQPSIKWVNDIYLNGKKVCGILAESVTDYKTGQITHIILGIGINCNANAIPAELADIAGAISGDYSVSQLAAEVLNQIHSIGSDFIKDYRNRSMVLGKDITVYKGGFTPDKQGIPARVLDIDDNGGLKVIYSDGSRETLSSGEISIRL